MKLCGVEPLGIEHDEQAVFELVRAVQQRPAALVENRGIGLKSASETVEHLAHRVHQQSEASSRALQNQDVLQRGRRAEDRAENAGSRW